MNNTFKPTFFLTLIFMFSSLPGYAFEWPWSKSETKVAADEIPVDGLNKHHTRNKLNNLYLAADKLSDNSEAKQIFKAQISDMDKTLDQAQNIKLLNEHLENKVAQDKLTMIVGAPVLVAAAVGITYWYQKNKHSKNMEMMQDVD